MRETKKTYTVNEVSELTGFTTRTIRNYIKSGKLSGKKLANQWRFTEEDISALSQLTQKRSKFKDKQFEFLNYINNCNIKIPNSCYICCYPSNKIEDLNSLRKEISKTQNPYSKITSDFFYHYNYKKRQSEFILYGTIDQVEKMNEIILKYIKEKS